MAALTLRAARADEAAALTELALRSKAHWGYDDAFMAACRDELTVDVAMLETGHVVVAEDDGARVGFFTLTGAPPIAEVDMMFVEPDRIGTGIGHALFARLCTDARAMGCRTLRIEADPHATEFYKREGAALVGEVASGSIAGRTLPLLHLDL